MSGGRKPMMLTMGEQTKSLTQWATETNLSKSTIRRRIEQGWPVERALTERPIEPDSPRAISPRQTPARQVKNTFAELILKAITGLSEEKQIKILQAKWEEDPIRFIEKVLIPLVPKDELEIKPSQSNNNANQPAQVYIEFNGNQLGNPMIGVDCQN